MSSTNQTNIADATAAATVKSDGKRDTGRTRRNNANDTPDVKLSKELAYILRHGAEKKGLKLRDDGSISLDDLRRYQKLKSVTFDEIKHAVDTNNKKRFTLYQEKDTWYIRAVQGHSLAIKEPPLVKLTAKTVPPVIVHGTMRGTIKAIEEGGLSKMGRTHIHFAKGLPSDADVISGMRKTANAYIYINIAKAMGDGIEFYESENGVILSKGLNDSGIIPAKYFESIQYRTTTASQ